jgi:hypothetical protein
MLRMTSTYMGPLRRRLHGGTYTLSLYEAANILNKQFSCFGLTMHLGSSTSKSKSEAMFFPASLKEAKLQTEPPEDLVLPGDARIHFTSSFKYLGSIITPLLNEDSEFKARIKKAKSLMGYAKYFFNNKDVDHGLKYQVYTSGPLNALLWSCETWNLSERIRNLGVSTTLQLDTSCSLTGIKSEKSILRIKKLEPCSSTFQISMHSSVREWQSMWGKMQEQMTQPFPKKISSLY